MIPSSFFMVKASISRERRALRLLEKSTSGRCSVFANGYGHYPRRCSVSILQFYRHAYHQNSLANKLFQCAAQRLDDEDSICEKCLVYDGLGGLELLDAEKIDSDRPDTFRD